MTGGIFMLGLAAARIALSAIFLVAGLAKLFDREGARQTLIDFGVPSGVAPPFAIALPLAEVAVAVALIPIASAWPGALGAFVLLLAFMAAIGGNLALGRRPDCHCFGQLHSSAVGWSTLARNGLFAAVAAFLVWTGRGNPGPSLLDWFGALPMSVRVLGPAAILGASLFAMLLLQILKQQGRILLRLDALDLRPSGLSAFDNGIGLSTGTLAPDFRLEALDGKRVALGDLLSNGKPLLLVFTNPHCGPCQALMPELGRWQREHRGRLSVAVISEGNLADNRSKAKELGLVLLQMKREVAEAYQAWGTPAAVLIRPDRTIGSAVAQGAEGIRTLFAYALNERAPAGENVRALVAAEAKLGDPAPELPLRDLDGAAVTLAHFRGRDALVLIWNPGCGFCRRMLPDLQRWDADLRPDGPILVVVSTGTAEEGRAMGLRSIVLLDPAGQATAVFDAPGTPSAVLIDAEGRIGSGVAAGAAAVWKLAGRQPDAAQFGPERSVAVARL
jgi:thiol-disulfide isomerase/thioredoxin